MNLKENLYEYRKNKGWSQEDIADKLDVSRQTVSKWEMGKSVPELDKLVKLSELYNVTVDDLLKGKFSTENILDDTEFKFENSGKKRKKFFTKQDLIIILILIVLIPIVVYNIVVKIRMKLIDNISEYYETEFAEIGLTKSGMIDEEVSKRENLGEIVETRKKYFYYITETGEKLLKITTYNENYTAIKETYIDLNKEKDLRYNDVTEVDLENYTYKVIDNYELLPPMTRVNGYLNYYYGLVGNIDSKYMAKDFNHHVLILKPSIEGDIFRAWNTDSIEKTGDNYEAHFSMQKHIGQIMWYSEIEYGLRQEQEEAMISFRTDYIPIEEEVTVPDLEGYTKID